jgi:REP element-mobilizing transposase RayT
VRPQFDGRRTPLHVTIRMARGVWNLRSQRGYRCVEAALQAEKILDVLRVVHFSVQGNHLHMIVETRDAPTLSRRMQGFGIRLAKAVNAMMHRPRGRVLADRYHARVLRTPREVHRCIGYVILNHQKHAAQAGKTSVAIDPFSSSPAFFHTAAARPPPVGPPETWLLSTGWRRVGPLALPKAIDTDTVSPRQ